MGFSLASRAHLTENARDTGARELPRRFAAGEAGAKDVNCGKGRQRSSIVGALSGLKRESGAVGGAAPALIARRKIYEQKHSQTLV